MRVIYCGVETRFRRVTDPGVLAEVRRRYQLDRPFILGLGTLEPRKNFLGLVEAFARLRQRRNLPHRLLIVGGKGWLYEPIFERVRDLGLEEWVHFPGFVADADLPAVYTLAACLAYPSFYEGFGVPALEAMACETPVLTTKTSSLPEVVGPAAVLVDPYDVDSLVEGLDRVLHDEPLRRELQAAGREQARRFTWERAAQELLSAYRSLVPRRAGS